LSRGPREAADVLRQLAPQHQQVERGERLQLARLAVVQLRHPLAQEFQPRREATLGPQHALRDGALHAEVARREPHDLGGLAVGIGAQHHGGGRDERHGLKLIAPQGAACMKTAAAAEGQAPTETVSSSA